MTHLGSKLDEFFKGCACMQYWKWFHKGVILILQKKRLRGTESLMNLSHVSQLVSEKTERLKHRYYHLLHSHSEQLA